jgi:hypothetical protein
MPGNAKDGHAKKAMNVGLLDLAPDFPFGLLDLAPGFQSGKNFFLNQKPPLQ